MGRKVIFIETHPFHLGWSEVLVYLRIFGGVKWLLIRVSLEGLLVSCLTKFKIARACSHSFETMRRCCVNLSCSNKKDHLSKFGKMGVLRRSYQDLLLLVRATSWFAGVGLAVSFHGGERSSSSCLFLYRL